MPSFKVGARGEGAVQGLYDIVKSQMDRRMQLDDERRQFRTKLVEALLQHGDIQNPADAFNFDPATGDISHLNIRPTMSNPLEIIKAIQTQPGNRDYQIEPEFKFGSKGGQETTIKMTPMTRPMNALQQDALATRQRHRSMLQQIFQNLLGTAPSSPTPSQGGEELVPGFKPDGTPVSVRRSQLERAMREGFRPE